MELTPTMPSVWAIDWLRIGEIQAHSVRPLKGIPSVIDLDVVRCR